MTFDNIDAVLDHLLTHTSKTQPVTLTDSMMASVSEMNKPGMKSAIAKMWDIEIAPILNMLTYCDRFNIRVLNFSDAVVTIKIHHEYIEQALHDFDIIHNSKGKIFELKLEHLNELKDILYNCEERYGMEVPYDLWQSIDIWEDSEIRKKKKI